MNFTPTRDWVILPLPTKTITDSGIILSEQAADSLKTNILKVVKAGPECKQVKQGDTVYVHPETSGVILTIDGVEYVAVNEFMIMGIL